MIRDERPQPGLELQLLGRFRVAIDGHWLDDRRWPLRSARSLIKLLALAPGQRLARERVMAALWPELPGKAAANALNKALHAARRGLEPDLRRGSASRFLLTADGHVALWAAQGVSVDAQRFERAAEQALRAQDPMAACDALRWRAGELLVDDLYEPWTFDSRARMQALFHHTTLLAGRGLAAAGQARQGIELLQRLVLHDPLDEPAQALLVQMLRDDGRWPQARSQLERARAAMALAGLQPGEALLALAREFDQRAQGEPSGSGEPPEPSEWPGTAWPVDPSGPSSLSSPYSGPAGVAATLAWHADAPAAPIEVDWHPRIEPLNFVPLRVHSVRAVPDGRSLLLSAEGEDRLIALYRLALPGLQMTRLTAEPAVLFDVSPQGRLAVGLRPVHRHPQLVSSALVLLDDAADVDAHPPVVLPDVQWATWVPAAHAADAGAVAETLAVVQVCDGRHVLAHPIGHVRHVSAGWISSPRCSPDGRWLAFLEHPVEHDDAGAVVVLDLIGGGLRAVTPLFTAIQSLAWQGDHLWFSASTVERQRDLMQLTPDGQLYRMHGGAQSLYLHDVTPDGRWLVGAERHEVGIVSRTGLGGTDRDIGLFQRGVPRDLSDDGQWLLVEEDLVAGRADRAAHLRRTDGLRTRRVGSGAPLALSPDQGRVLLRQADGPNGVKGALVLHDLDSGHQQRLPPGADGPLVYNEFAGFSPCGTRIAFSATDARGALRVYVQDLAGGPPAAIIAAEDPVRMPWNRPFSPDGRSLVLMGVDDRVFLHRLDTGEQRRLPGMCRDFRVVNWTADGLGLFVHRLFEREPQVMRYDLASGTFTPWQALSAPGHVQLPFVRKVCITPDGLTLAYAWSSMRTDLWGFSEADA